CSHQYAQFFNMQLDQITPFHSSSRPFQFGAVTPQRNNRLHLLCKGARITLERAVAGANLPQSDQDSPASSEPEVGDRGEVPTGFTAWLRHPTTAVQENGTYGGTKAKPLAAYRRRLCCLCSAVNTELAKANTRSALWSSRS